MEFRAEFFNLFNKTNFLAPNSRADQGNFGTINNTFPARQIQFALKAYFWVPHQGKVRERLTGMRWAVSGLV